ncbi:MAG: RHS repeat protein, partial [Akkermansia sp.]|nr:RHS repeat protein [Akkermansia sp.]
MQIIPDYKRWFTPAGEISTPSLRSAASLQAGDIIAHGSGNKNQNPPTYAKQEDVIFDINVPKVLDENGEEMSILARIEATFSVEDWGYVMVDGQKIISMTREDEPAGPRGGHATWPARSGSTVVSSGQHQLVFHYENINMADAANNKIVCEYSYRVVALESGGNREVSSCGCGGSTCSLEGGVPTARSGESVASSSAGSDVSATITEDSLYWSCNVGALRGMGAALGGKLVLQAKDLSAALASPAALQFNHPMHATLHLPEGGIQPGCRMEINQGNRVIALRYYADGTLSPVGVDTMGLGKVSLRDASGNTPAALRWQDSTGAAWLFSQQDGSLLSYTSPDGVVIEDVSAYLAVHWVNDAVSQVWSYWDGLLQVENATDSGYTLALYTPDQVGGRDDSGAFTLFPGAEPFKSFDFAWHGDSLSVTERSQLLNEVVTTWQQDVSGAWSISRGAGNEASTTTCVRTVLEPASELGLEVWQQVTTVSRAGQVASCTCEVYQNSPLGQLLLTRVEGYGSATASTTQFEYDGSGNEIRRTAPDGSVTESCYDSTGRLLKSFEPWRGGHYTLITDYSYVNSSNSQFNGDISQVIQKLSPADGGLLTTLSTETHTYSRSGGVLREEIRTTASGSPHTHLEITETWTGEAADSLNRGRLRMRQGVDGVQEWYEYSATVLHGALYAITQESRVAGEPVPGQSRRSVSFVNAAGNTVRQEEYALLSDGSTWALLSGVSHRYDAQNHRVGSVKDNGRTSSSEVNCTGSPIWETDEDGITTTYLYDSARRLVESIRAEVLENGTVVTPETITEYVYDAEGRTVSVITHTGAMRTARHTSYDGSGRTVSTTDELGRITTMAYSADGLTTTVTAPSGATTITTTHADGSTARISGTAQREVVYSYSLQNGCICEMQQLADGTIIAQTTTNGFGETVVQAQPNTLGGFICSRSEYNALGQLVKSWSDTGLDSEPTAATHYEYDSMGNVVKQTLALAEQPSPENSPITETSFGAESLEDGVYSVITTTRYNAAAQPLTSVQKQLISQLSGTIESKSVFVSERGLTSMQWTEYSEHTKRVQYSTVPTSSITAKAVTVDGFALSQKDTAGVVTSFTRSYTVNGMVLTQTDGRGNTTTTVADKAGRALMVTDAAGNVTTTVYCDCCDQPATITDAQGNTTCYRFDERGRKVAEWGTAVQPATFSYDDAGNLVSLTTYRNPDVVLSTDPSELSGDVTTWTCDPATGLELRKTYADNTSVVKIYDAHNRLVTETNARGKMKRHAYEHARGLLLGTTYYHAPQDGEEPVTDSLTPARSYAYNHLGQLTQVMDAAGVRTISYNQYGEQEIDSLVVDGDTHLITEARDAQGRSTCYVYSKNGTTQQTVTTGYGEDGRISSAGFLHGGAEKQFSYEYLPGTHLLQKLNKPNGMSLTQSFESQRDLLIGMAYHRGTTLVAQRTYTYDTLGRPLSRSTARNGQTVNDSFGYNNRSELTTATVNGGAYAYDYDNIGNRKTAQEATEEVTGYTANELNQYTALAVDGV